MGVGSAPSACDDFETPFERPHDSQVLQQAVCGEGGGERLRIVRAPGATGVALASGRAVERYVLDRHGRLACMPGVTASAGAARGVGAIATRHGILPRVPTQRAKCADPPLRLARRTK